MSFRDVQSANVFANAVYHFLALLRLAFDFPNHPKQRGDRVLGFSQLFVNIPVYAALGSHALGREGKGKGMKKRSAVLHGSG